MSFLNKVKASAGIGNAKVDTRITESNVKQGGLVSGEVVTANQRYYAIGRNIRISRARRPQISEGFANPAGKGM